MENPKDRSMPEDNSRANPISAREMKNLFELTKKQVPVPDDTERVDLLRSNLCEFTNIDSDRLVDLSQAYLEFLYDQLKISRMGKEASDDFYSRLKKTEELTELLERIDNKEI